jgi:Tfp pilus assembly protein PilN
MEQRINFYDKLDRPGKDWLNLTFIALICALVLFVMGAISVTMMSMQRSSYKQLSDLHSDIDQIRKNVNELMVVQQRSADNTIFLRKIELLEAERLIKSRVSSALQLHPFEGGVGFTGYMSALASHSERGLWFTRIVLQDAGKNIELGGMVKDPESVPRYLQALQSQDIFAGHQFSMMRIAPSAQEKWLYEFELLTKPGN